ncbi:MAG: lamin tail domain-containing protein [Pirellulales bacterium]|nr:lamin tail domain-containing protein [Pirellulales bacterium]
MSLRTISLRLLAAITLTAATLAASPASAQIRITEVMSSSLSTGDWFELTNTSASVVNLQNYYWDDNGPTGNDGALFPLINVQPGESIVIVDAADATTVSNFVSNWLGGFAAYGSYEFGGPDTFSGLSSNGDQIELWDADPNTNPSANLISSATFPAATQGSTFAWAENGTDLGVSVSGQLLAFTGLNNDIGSPGVAVVPEPSSIVLAAFAGLGLAGYAARRRSRKATRAAA